MLLIEYNTRLMKDNFMSEVPNKLVLMITFSFHITQCVLFTIINVLHNKLT
jgi:hypothetical protein